MWSIYQKSLQIWSDFKNIYSLLPYKGLKKDISILGKISTLSPSQKKIQSSISLKKVHDICKYCLKKTTQL